MFSGGQNAQKWDFFFEIFSVLFIFEVDFLPPLIFLELNIVIFGNIIYKCPTFTGKITYFTAHMGHSGMSTKFQTFSQLIQITLYLQVVNDDIVKCLLFTGCD